MEMYAFSMSQADPATWLLQYVSWEAATKENKWQGRNISRWRNAEYDAAYNAAQSELDPVKRAALLIKANDLAVSGNVLPLIHRAEVSGVSNTLVAPRSGWDNDLSFLPEWSRQT